MAPFPAAGGAALALENFKALFRYWRITEVSCV